MCKLKVKLDLVFNLLWPFKSFAYVQHYMDTAQAIAMDGNRKRMVSILGVWLVQALFALHNIVLYFAPPRNDYQRTVYVDLPGNMKLPPSLYLLFALQAPLYAYYYRDLYWGMPKLRLFKVLQATLESQNAQKKYFLIDDREKIVAKTMRDVHLFQLLKLGYGKCTGHH